jgi:lipopolysaccharide heptosyltransferase II
MKILIINVNWLGDVLFSTPLIRCLKKKYPSSYIGCLLPERCFPILTMNPNVDKLIPIDEKKERGVKFDFSVVKELKKYKFDISLHLHRSFSRRMLAFLSEIQERIGYSIKLKGFLLTKKIELPSKNFHRAMYYFHLGEVLGIEYDQKGCDFYLSNEDLDYMKKLLKENKIKEKEYIVLNPGGNWIPKRWPTTYWAKLADLIQKNVNKRVIISGSNSDVLLANKIKSKMDSNPIIFVGKTNLKQLGVLFKLSHFLISADTFPLHLAYALSTPVIGLYGPTSPKITGPFGKGKAIIVKKDVGCKIPCYIKKCNLNYKCMTSITPELVYEEAVSKFIQET